MFYPNLRLSEEEHLSAHIYEMTMIESEQSEMNSVREAVILPLETENNIRLPVQTQMSEDSCDFKAKVQSPKYLS